MGELQIGFLFGIGFFAAFAMVLAVVVLLVLVALFASYISNKGKRTRSDGRQPKNASLDEM